MPKNWADVVILVIEAALMGAMAVEIVRSLHLVWKAKWQRVPHRKRAWAGPISPETAAAEASAKSTE